MRRFLPFLLLSTAAFSAGVPYIRARAVSHASGNRLCLRRRHLGGAGEGRRGAPAGVASRRGIRPLYSPDGAKLAFVSTRTGGGDIYILTLASGELKRLTFDDRLDQLDAWSRDGKWIYFSNGTHDVGGKNDLYRVSVEGGTPMPVSADRFTNEFQAAPAPGRRRPSRSPRAATAIRSGGVTATAIWTNPKSGCARKGRPPLTRSWST